MNEVVQKLEKDLESVKLDLKKLLQNKITTFLEDGKEEKSNILTENVLRCLITETVIKKRYKTYLDLPQITRLALKNDIKDNL